MTTIAVKREEDTVYYAADSMSTDGIFKYKNIDKIRMVGDIIIAFAGDDETLSDFAQYLDNRGFRGRGICDGAQMTDDRFRLIMKDYIARFAKENNIEEQNRIGFIATNIVTGNTVTSVWTHVEIMPVNSFFAIGGGRELAIGAMEAGADVVTAVNISAKHHLYTMLPIFTAKIHNSIVIGPQILNENEDNL